MGYSASGLSPVKVSSGTVSVSSGTVSVSSSDTSPVYTKPANGLLDAFGRARTSNPIMLFSGVRDYARGGGQVMDHLRFTYTAVNGATVSINTNGASCNLTVATNATSSVKFQTKEYFLYRAGQSHGADYTFTLGAATEGIRKRVGYFDDNDGVFLEQSASGGTLLLVLRSSTSGAPDDTRIPQSQWNYDKLDGTGYSGYNLNAAKSQIGITDLQFLGVGEVRVGFSLDGGFISAHHFSNANNTEGSYMRSATLPIRWEITNVNGSAASDTLEQICCTATREGAEDEPAVFTPIYNNANVTLGTSWTVLLAVGLRSDCIRASLRQFEAAVINTDNTNAVEFQLIFNPTVSGTITYTNVSTNHSVAKYADNPGRTITAKSGHIEIFGYAPAANRGGSGIPRGGRDNLPLVADIAGNSDLAILAARAVSGSPQVRGTLSFREYY